MLNQIIDPNIQNGKGCATCCCTELNGRPGETLPLTLDYAEWAVPIGGRGLSETAVDIDEIHAPKSPISVAQASLTTPFNTPLVGSLFGNVTNPDSLPLTFDHLPFDGPAHGVVTINAAGAFTYTPTTGFAGYDRFFYSVTPEGGKPVVAEFVVGVEPQVGSLPAVQYTPDVQVPASRITVNRSLALVRLGVVISPAAPIGAIYRMTIRTKTLDCDCNEYSHTSCYDLVIGKC
jgi:hypothetical protein